MTAEYKKKERTPAKNNNSLISIILQLGLFSLIFLGVSSAIFSSFFDESLTDWAQAIGSIIAVSAGFSVAIWQAQGIHQDRLDDRDAIVQTAYFLSYEAIATVTERLDRALPEGMKENSLQGNRTSEIIIAMREFDTAKLPINLITLFIKIRSHVFAVNERISEVYNSEESLGRDKKERRTRLENAIFVRNKVVNLFEEFEHQCGNYNIKKSPLFLKRKNYDPEPENI